MFGWFPLWGFYEYCRCIQVSVWTYIFIYFAYIEAESLGHRRTWGFPSRRTARLPFQSGFRILCSQKQCMKNIHDLDSIEKLPCGQGRAPLGTQCQAYKYRPTGASKTLLVWGKKKSLARRSWFILSSLRSHRRRGHSLRGFAYGESSGLCSVSKSPWVRGIRVPGVG